MRHNLLAFIALAHAATIGAGCAVDEGSAESQAEPLSAAAAVQTYIDTTFYSDADIQYSFATTAGEKVDCIDFYSQRSVRSQLARGAWVPDPASLPDPPPMPGSIPKPHKPAGASVAFDGTLDANGHAQKCPAGTVPTMRPTVKAIAAAGGLDAYRSRRPPLPMKDPNQDPIQHDCYHQFSPGPGYDHAAGVHMPVGTYYGALSFLSINQPYVYNTSTEHSLSEIWIQTGDCESWTSYNDPDNCTTGGNGDAVQSLEVGWMVGDDSLWSNEPQAPHLFVFITQDGYDTKWCFSGSSYCYTDYPYGNSTADAWVIAPGAPFTLNQSLGQYVQPLGSDPAEMAIQVWNGTTHGYPAWFVWIDGQLLGWYPADTFAGQMQSSASYIQAGGEVYDSWPNNAHTTTQLGTGIFPSVPPPAQTYQMCSYQRNLSYIDSGSNYNDMALGFITTPPAELDDNRLGICGYDAGDYGYGLDLGDLPSGWGSSFSFGGNEIF